MAWAIEFTIDKKKGDYLPKDHSDDCRDDCHSLTHDSLSEAKSESSSDSVSESTFESVNKSTLEMLVLITWAVELSYDKKGSHKSDDCLNLTQDSFSESVI